MSRTASQPSLPIPCESSPITIIDNECPWLVPTTFGLAFIGWLFEHPWTCYGCLALLSTRLISDWINYCPPIPWDSFMLPPPCASPVFDMDPWFLRPPFGIQVAPVMPSAPSYPDAAFITVSWIIDNALDCDLDSIVEDYLSDADLFYFDAIADPPPPEPPPFPDPVTSTIGDHDPSHIARLSTVLHSTPCITVSFDLVRPGSYHRRTLSQRSSPPSTNWDAFPAYPLETPRSSSIVELQFSSHQYAQTSPPTSQVTLRSEVWANKTR